MSRLFEYTGLGAALVGALAMVRGEWSEAGGCLVVVVVASFLAALWETGPDPTRKEGARGNDPGR